MGNQNEKTKEPDFQKSFFTEELNVLMYKCRKLERCSLQSVFDLQSIPSYILDRLWKFIKITCGTTSRERRITLKGFLSTVEQLLRKTVTEQSHIIMYLATDSVGTNIPSQDLYNFISDILDVYLETTENSKEYSSWKSLINGADSDIVHQLVDCLLYDLLWNGTNKDKEHKNEAVNLNNACPHVTLEDLEKWLQRTPIFRGCFQRVFEIGFGLIKQRETVPNLLGDQLFPLCKKENCKVESLLSMSAVLYLNQQIPLVLRNEWRYLFSTRQFGESFSQLLGKILNRGPTILIILDKKGHIFGGFCSEGWQIRPKFSGSDDCFLFSTHPRLGVYFTTGYNDHYMYLNINQQTMPNGLGMGGQLNYFGIWLDSDFGKGSCTTTCTTYTSPQLSLSTQFQIDTVEVWAVGPVPKNDDENAGKERSALDKLDSETKLMLSLMDRAPKSDAIREEDAKLDEACGPVNVSR